MTQAGIVLGTPPTCPRSKREGCAVDKRADIWAFGCVLHEMLCGKRTFKGDDVGETLASILRDQPEWTALPAARRPRFGCS